MTMTTACRFVFMLGLVSRSLTAKVTVSNVEPRTDVNGQLMDIHDGNVFWDAAEGSWLWYGMGYTNCTLETGVIPPRDCPGIYRKFGEGCGFRADHQVNLYSSPDLVTWTYLGDVYPQGGRPEGIYFRPKVLYNPKAEEYVLWINYLPPAFNPLKSYPDATFAVATSKTAAGPFEVVTPSVSIANPGGGDFTVMVDPNSDEGTAYLAYDAWSNSHSVVIEQLTDDWHNSLGNVSTTGSLSEEKNEAPILFERKGTYYLLYGHTCCFCRQGSGAIVMTAPHPLGPWTLADDINPPSGLLGYGERAIKAQCNFVIQASNGQYLYTGDLWATAADKLKSHDLQYWYPLEFDDSTEPPTIQQMGWVDSFEMDV